MSLKVVIKIWFLKNFHLCLILILLFFSIIFNFVFDFKTTMNIFLYSVLFHTLISICVFCSIYEHRILHEKQGSKLNLSKEKLSKNSI